MAKKVVLTERARQDYLNIIQHLTEIWTAKEIEKFEQKFLKAVSVLESHPKAFIVSRNNTRKFAFDKHNIIHYRIKKDTIEIWLFGQGNVTRRRSSIDSSIIELATYSPQIMR